MLSATFPRFHMALNIPSGYVTRPAAERKYNRSARSLERDLDSARTSNDGEVLSAFMLCTNDGNIREAKDVTAEIVNELTKVERKNPTWVVSESWLEQTYGKKGAPLPQKNREVPQRASSRTNTPSAEEPTEQVSPEEGSEPITSALPDDIEYLKERIRVLEREKQAEIKRNEDREQKLFAQLEVKDKQIAAWDEVSQGIAKALATGKLKPSEQAPKKIGTTDGRDSQNNDVVEAHIIDDNQDEIRQKEAAESKAAKKPTGSNKAKPSAKKKTTAIKKSRERKESWLEKNLPSIFARN